jgi:hypothetical protein
VGTNVNSFLGKCRILPVFILVAGLAACFSDRVSSPESATQIAAGPSASYSTTATSKKVKGLLWKSRLKSDVSVTRTITSSVGGLIKVPGTDFELVIPAGAFDEPTMTITVTALKGRVVAYEFAPHGVLFKKPLLFSQRLAQTNWDRSLSANKSSVQGAHFFDRTKVDSDNGFAWVNEFFPSTVQGNLLTFPIPHFSGFMISTGLMEEEGF